MGPNIDTIGLILGLIFALWIFFRKKIARQIRSSYVKRTTNFQKNPACGGLKEVHILSLNGYFFLKKT